MTAVVFPRSVRVVGIVFACALGVGLVAVVLALGWIGVRGAIAADSLRSAKAAATEVVANISDPGAAATAIGDIAADTASAHALTSDPVWRVMERAPWLGPQLVAVSSVAEAADDVATSGLTPLAEVAATLPASAFRPTEGRIDLAGFLAVQDAAAQSALTLREANASLDRISDAALVGPLRDIVTEVSETFDQAGAATEALANASVLIPAMLGAEGPRNYLVLFQNNAEWRSLGGIAGATALIHTDGGSLQLAAQSAGASFGRFDPPISALEPEVAAIYGQNPAQWMQNVTQVPEFSVAGSLAREMWASRYGTAVDGVLAIDPVALSYILRSTGPVTLATGDVLSADNAVQLLLNEVYLRYSDPTEQNRFFADATASVFRALTSGGADPTALLEALARGGEENRLYLWSAHPEDQSVLEGTTVAGALPVTDDENTRFGVYLNDGTESKIDFYQTVDTTTQWRSCAVDARGRASGVAEVTVSLANNAPAELPDYVTGGGAAGVAPGSARTVGYIYAPKGFELVDASLSNGSGFGGGFHDGRQVLSFDVTLAPGESLTATVAVASAAPAGEALDALVTPTINANVTTSISTCL